MILDHSLCPIECLFSFCIFRISLNTKNTIEYNKFNCVSENKKVKCSRFVICKDNIDPHYKDSKLNNRNLFEKKICAKV